MNGNPVTPRAVPANAPPRCSRCLPSWLERINDSLQFRQPVKVGAVVALDALVAELDALWDVAQAGPDPSMSRNLPRVYEEARVDWRALVEPQFAVLFNGLMFRGAAEVGRVSGACFPSAEVLDQWLPAARPGDLLITHHPIDLRNGTPDEVWAEGFVPISGGRLAAIRARRVSMYAVHAPMDTCAQVGTTAAIVEALGGRVEDRIWPYGNGYAGVICRVASASTDALAGRLQQIFGVGRLEIEGARRDRIERIAVVAGVGDDAVAMRDAEARGAQAWVTGELHVRIEGDRGRRKYAQVKALNTGMSLFGASHAATEHLVMRTQLARWFQGRAAYDTIDEPEWWR
jgi:putative NIF3 family GTP cyclohydrolase 1 type 2